MKKQFSTLVQAAATVEERDRLENTNGHNMNQLPNLGQNQQHQQQQPPQQPMQSTIRRRNSASLSCDEQQTRRNSANISSMKIPHSILFDNQTSLNNKSSTNNSRQLQSASTSRIDFLDEKSENHPSSQRSRTMERSMSHHMDYSSTSSGSITRAVSQEDASSIKRSSSHGCTLAHQVNGAKSSRTLSPSVAPSTTSTTANSSNTVLTTNQNPFVTIIKKMLSKESQIKYRTIDSRFPVFGWSDDGRYLMIRNPQTLFSKMMADFFVTTNLQSFVRQLNHYNFVKIKTSTPTLNSKRQQDETLVYEHTKFNRDNQCDLERKPKLFSRKRSPGSGLGCSCSYDMTNYVTREEYNNILKEHKVLWNVIQRHEDELQKMGDLKMNMEIQMDWLKGLLTNHPDFCRSTTFRTSPNGNGSSSLNGNVSNTNSNSNGNSNGSTDSNDGSRQSPGGSSETNGTANVSDGPKKRPVVTKMESDINETDKLPL